jgi:hypothetical protein
MMLASVDAPVRRGESVDDGIAELSLDCCDSYWK